MPGTDGTDEIDVEEYKADAKADAVKSSQRSCSAIIFEYTPILRTASKCPFGAG
jgi:hypothetical protein